MHTRRHRTIAPPSVAPVRPLRGYSLTELLVAIVVIAVGALGVAGLQLASSKNSRGALERTIAAILADDMIERMRANPKGDYAGATAGVAPPGFVDCLARNCTSVELAQFDVAVWKCALGRWHLTPPCGAVRAAGVLPDERSQPGLPEGDGAIAWGPGRSFRVAVTWRNAGEQRVVVGGLL